jgi:hypothetical protein
MIDWPEAAEKKTVNGKTATWTGLCLKFLWYALLIFLIFLFWDAPQRGFRYWGM